MIPVTSLPFIQKGEKRAEPHPLFFVKTNQHLRGFSAEGRVLQGLSWSREVLGTGFLPPEVDAPNACHCVLLCTTLLRRRVAELNKQFWRSHQSPSSLIMDGYPFRTTIARFSHIFNIREGHVQRAVYIYIYIICSYKNISYDIYISTHICIC